MNSAHCLHTEGMVGGHQRHTDTIERKKITKERWVVERGRKSDKETEQRRRKAGEKRWRNRVTEREGKE